MKRKPGRLRETKLLSLVAVLIFVSTFHHATATKIEQDNVQLTQLFHSNIQTANTLLEEESELDPYIIGVFKLNPTTVDILFSNNQRMTIDFYGENIFRLFRDNRGGIIRDPEAKPEAQILVDNPRLPVSKVITNDNGNTISIKTKKIEIALDKKNALLKVINLETNSVVLEEIASPRFEKDRVTITLKENPEEYFYGGGVQNGRFSHKGKAIAIENQNSWTDGGVASPTPFYWSTKGYGVMWYTFKRGRYDFGAKEKGVVTIYHETDYSDIFYMINDRAVALLNDFYQLTGRPVLLPKFAFYQGHLNAYNRDYWVEDSTGILFEDGKRYKESQQDNGGIKESLNGEKNNYQFSARAVIDRYSNHDMPFGWLLPNDGYGAGYGQTESLDGNIQNLKELTEYAEMKGVKIGLWTQSALHPRPDVSALLQRDIVKEVRDAGVRVLKTDVAWVGPGYSFGLNGVSDAAHIMNYYGNNSRPFIISLDGWAGTQRYATIWTGDQSGGAWEYIRFHIPTYLGSGLSGQPNITSDMDGIFGGNNPIINIRDFQWKTFTPMELNMDGWGSNPKYPHALGEPATSINRWYLKLKSELLPYTYTIAKEAVAGLPIIRAMFLEYPNSYTLGKATQYQFMYGPYFLVAPIYQATQSDRLGNDIRDGIYLPEGRWIDYFTGEVYEGEQVINNFPAPIWKLPLFVKSGAIIPLVNPNNNPSQVDTKSRIYELYPYGTGIFMEYDDDGISEEYKQNKNVCTEIETHVDNKNNVTVTIHPSQGYFPTFTKEKSTTLIVNVTEKPKKITAKIGTKKIKLSTVNSLDEFNAKENVIFYNAAPNLNKYATPESKFAKEVITKNPQLMVKLATTDITANRVTLMVQGFQFSPSDKLRITGGALTTPLVDITDDNIEAYTLKPTWSKVENADFYEIEFNNMRYGTIKGTELFFDGLSAETLYLFKIRAVNKDGYSEWSEFSATTGANPLEFAIMGVTGETTASNQRGSGIEKLFNFDESDLWHTSWGTVATPFDLIIDLKTINRLDKFHYLPRIGSGNGTLLKGSVHYSHDKEQWIEAGTFNWGKNDETKLFDFIDKPSARYIKLSVEDGVGKFGSGRELYIFKVPGSSSYIPGDINNDGKLDHNDLVSYMNYTGLRMGDADFEGYISNGDLNKNNLIDAYDISVPATQLGEKIDLRQIEKIKGSIELTTAKQRYNKDEIIEIYVKGKELRSLNALSFALPYDTQDYEFIGIEPLNMKNMENFTRDRLHSNGEKALYPTFINIGDEEVIEGTLDLFILRFKAKTKVLFNLKPIDGFLLDKALRRIKF